MKNTQKSQPNELCLNGKKKDAVTMIKSIEELVQNM
jgi:hypothetical protein